MKKIKSSKGQVFTWDIILATVLFMSFMTILIYLWTDTISKINNAEVQYETGWLSTAVSEGLVRTPGRPVNWSLDPQLSSIQVMGLADVEIYGNETAPLDRILDSDKLIDFINITNDNYRGVRNKLFGTGRYDFYIELYCPDQHSMDCFNNLRADVINDTVNVTCNDSSLFYVKNHTVRTDKDLMATLRFDEGNGNNTYDSSGNGNDALNHGATWTNGRFGKALEFDGTNDYAQITNYTNLNLSSEMTIEAWIKVNKSQSEWQTIAAKGEWTDPRTFFLGVRKNIPPQPNALDFEFEDTSGNRVTVWGTTSLVDTNWHHVAATMKANGTIRLFVDGILEKDTVIAPVKAAQNPYPLVIGAEYATNPPSPGYKYFFGGMIDDVKIWNRSLDDQEIATEYQSDPKTCIIGQNTLANNTNYMIYDVKTVTFMEKVNQERNFNEDIVSLDPTARIKLIIYQKKGRDL